MKINTELNKQKRTKVDIDTPDDGIPATDVEAIAPLFKSNQDALVAYCKELEQIATTYSLTSEELLVRAHKTVGQYNPKLERALTLNRRISILKNV